MNSLVNTPRPDASSDEPSSPSRDPAALAALMVEVRAWAHEAGFSQIGVAHVDLSEAEAGLQAWLDAGFHGEMQYMAAHGMKRARPAELVPGTISILTARMDYLPEAAGDAWQDREWAAMRDPARAQVSLYARGRDYHKVLRQRLQQLADRIQDRVGPMGHRVFTDSAPVLEVELASRSGIGWRGKHTLTLHRDSGSMFFLGEIYLDLALPPSEPVTAHCGQCRACLDACPTGAIVAPYRLDARRCISYLTIEQDGPIPLEFREAIGNRIYGCDDCQLACPWNKFARRNPLPDFEWREPLGDASLLALFAWDEATFLKRTEGSAIRRIGHARWRRNIAVAMGNALRQELAPDLRSRLMAALHVARADAAPVLAEHIDWALAQDARRPIPRSPS